MNLSHLRYIVEVEKTRSITKAAQNLYMGQPNLSKAIKELEGELNITLFRRTAKGVEPTQKGAEFLGYAKTILSQVDELESMYKPHDNPVLKLNVSVPRASYISAAFASFMNEQERDTHMAVRYRETSAISAVNDVSAGESDVGIIRYQTIYEPYFMGLIKNNWLQYEVLREFRHCLVMSESHTLAGMDVVPYHMLDGYTEIVHGDFQVPSLSLAEVKKSAEFRAANKKIFVFDRGSHLDLLERVTDTFMWVSPIPQSILSQHHLVQRESMPRGSLTRDVLIYPVDSDPSPCCQAFIDFLKGLAPEFCL